MIIRPARAEEAGVISALALRSKGFWGYDAAFLEACREDLTIDPGWCDGRHLIVAEDDGGLRGYARVSGEPPRGALDGLFVDPGAIGTGVGKALLHHAIDIARDSGMHTLEIDSDPYAEPFYLHAGAVRVGTSRSTVDPDRRLPRLELRLTSPRRPGATADPRAR